MRNTNPSLRHSSVFAYVKVCEVRGARAAVKASPEARCAACASGTGCGADTVLLTPRALNPLWVARPAALKVGDYAYLRISAFGLCIAAFAVFAIPLLGLFAGGWFGAEWLRSALGWGTVTAESGGMLVGFLAGLALLGSARWVDIFPRMLTPELVPGVLRE
jgi:positive regulator of sigma E activity